MHAQAPMRVVQGVAEPLHQPQTVGGGLGPARDVAGDGLALLELHDQVGQLAFGSSVEEARGGVGPHPLDGGGQLGVLRRRRREGEGSTVRRQLDQCREQPFDAASGRG